MATRRSLQYHGIWLQKHQTIKCNNKISTKSGKRRDSNWVAVVGHPPELLVHGKQSTQEHIVSTHGKQRSWKSLGKTKIQVYDHEVSTVVVLDSPRLGTKYPAFWPMDMGQLFRISISTFSSVLTINLKHVNFREAKEVWPCVQCGEGWGRQGRNWK